VVFKRRAFAMSFACASACMPKFPIVTYIDPLYWLYNRRAGGGFLLHSQGALNSCVLAFLPSAYCSPVLLSDLSCINGFRSVFMLL